MNRKKMWFVRTMLLLSLPFLLGWAFISEFCRGLRSAFRYGWLDVRIEYGDFNRVWESYDGSDQSSEKIGKS